MNKRLRRFLVLAAIVVFVFTACANADGFKTNFNVKIPMRDGVKLSADIWIPNHPADPCRIGEDERYPAILVRTPYVKGLFEQTQIGPIFANNGYAVIIQDVRGRGDSEGEFNFFSNEAKDGYDTIEWIASAPWSNGKIGMMGVSYLATAQWLAAKECPPHLTCIVPTAPGGQYFWEVPYKGGAFMMEWALDWYYGTSGKMQQFGNLGMDMEQVYKYRPLIKADEAALGISMKSYKEVLMHPTLDAYWKRIIFSPQDFKKVNIPVLTVTGWFDDDQPGALYYWDGMNKYSAAKNDQFLVIGPWTHNQTFMGGAEKIGEIEFSKDSIIDNKSLHLAFFDHYLKGHSIDNFPCVKVYVTGINKWMEFNEYPPKNIKYTNLYLSSGGHANTILGDGKLIWNTGSGEVSDQYTYDPKNPFKVKSDNFAVDNRIPQLRKDALVYTTGELKNHLRIIGPVTLQLYASTDCRDTDFMAKIIDVYPDGRAVNLGCEAISIIRARYRNGFEKEEPLVPWKIEKYTISFRDIGHTFLRGHKIQILVTSSAYPMINPNQNTGNPVATDTVWKIAHQTVYHGGKYPSCVVLPVLDFEATQM